MVMPLGADTRLKASVLVGISESVAEADTFKAADSLIVWSAGRESTGAELTSFTTTLNDFVSLRGGVPLSVTRTVTVLVLGPCVSVGVHEMAPVFVSIVIPGGEEIRLKTSVLTGISESMAEAETFSVACSLTV